MDKRKHEYPVISRNQELEIDLSQPAYDLTGEESNSKIDGLQVREYRMAMSVIQELHEGLLEDRAADVRTVKRARLTVEATEITDHFQFAFTRGSASGDEGVREASLPAEHGDQKSEGRDFRQRYAQLSSRLNRQLAGLQATGQQVRKATELLSDSVEYLTDGVGKVEDGLERLKYKPDPESQSGS